MFRMVGLCITLAVIALMYVYMNRSAEKAVNTNASVVEQKQVLQQATGIDPNDSKQLRDYTMKQAQEIQNYQDQVNSMATGE